MTPTTLVDRRLDALTDDGATVSFEHLFRFDTPLNRQIEVKQWREKHGTDTA